MQTVRGFCVKKPNLQNKGKMCLFYAAELSIQRMILKHFIALKQILFAILPGQKSVKIKLLNKLLKHFIVKRTAVSNFTTSFSAGIKTAK